MIERCGTANLQTGILCQLPKNHEGPHETNGYYIPMVPVHPWYTFWRGRWAWLWILLIVFVSIFAGVAQTQSIHTDCTTTMTSSGGTYHSTLVCK